VAKSKPPLERSTVLQKQFREDLQFWIKYDRKIALKILELMEDIHRDPFVGKGKPEPLKHLPGNLWSRRITLEDRLVYRVYENTVDFLQCKYHY
jgi:toxin YoeB